MTRSLPARMGLACGLAVAAAVLPGAAGAQEGVAIKNLLGNMGILPREKETIYYRERAPLVVPPKAELRTPAPSGGYASANPQWPTDPDVAARRRRAEEERTPVTWSESRRMLDDNNTRLSPQELARGRVAATATPSAPVGRNQLNDTRDSVLLSPLELLAGPKPEADTRVAAGGEPARRTLTEPPGGLRRSTGKGNGDIVAPRIDQQQYDANPMNWLTRRFKSEDDD